MRKEYRAMLIGGMLGAYGMSCVGLGIITGKFLQKEIVQHQLEKSYEDDIGKPIIDDDAKRRQERIVRFKEMHRDVRNSWDQYEEQFSLFDTISFYENPSSPEIAGVRYSKRYPEIELRIKFANMDPKAGPPTLVHEMAHAWHDTLSQKRAFEEQWKMIAGDGYTNDPTYPEDFCFGPMTKVAAVDCYGATNLGEDVARVAEIVYELKTEPNLFVVKDEAPRIRKKVNLAAAYGFFSERERDTALERIVEKLPEERGMVTLVR